MNKKLLIVVNTDWIFIAHRLPIALAALEKGCQVTVMAKDSGRVNEITALGFKFVNLSITRSGVNPVIEFFLLIQLFKWYWEMKPDIVYHITMKPVIYGSIVARILGIKTVNAISGLGYNFTANRRGWVQAVMIQLMKWGFKKPHNYLVFENKDDLNELKALHIVHHKNHLQIIKGVGVDLEAYHIKEVNKIGPPVTVLLPTRMLWDKGVREFVESAILLKEKLIGKAVFLLCGMIDSENKEAVPENYLRTIAIPDYLQWVGHQQDMVAIYKKTDIVVLPSYREGMPTVLLEACAAGKPIVTTNAIGCMECVEEGKNGYKVPVKSIQELAHAIEKIINAPEDRFRMGAYSRQKAVREFDQKEVVRKHLEIFERMLST